MIHLTLGLSVILSSVALGQDLPSPVAPAAICEAMLNVVVPAPATDTVNTLLRVRAIVAGTYPGPKLSPDYRATIADLDVLTNVKLFASNLVPDGFSKRSLVEARLTQILQDLTGGGFDVSYVAREFSGAEVIDRERRALLDRAVRTNEAMERYLPSLYVRPNKLNDLVARATLLATAPALAHWAVGVQPHGLLVVPLIGAGYLAVRAGTRAVKRWLSLSHALAKHTRELGWKVHGPSPDFAMFGGSITMPYSVFRALRDDVNTPPTGERARALAVATEDATRASLTPLTPAERMLAREVFFDSIYFKDEAGVPHWIIVLRARKLPPGPPPTMPGVSLAPSHTGYEALVPAAATAGR